MSNNAEGKIDNMVSSKRRVKSNIPGTVGPKESTEYFIKEEFEDMLGDAASLDLSTTSHLLNEDTGFIQEDTEDAVEWRR